MSAVEVIEGLLQLAAGETVSAPHLDTLIANTAIATSMAPFHQAARADFGDVPGLLATATHRAVQDPAKTGHRINWIVRKLADWRPATDPNGVQLFAALSAANVVDRDDSFWLAAASEIQKNRALSSALEIVAKRWNIRPEVLPEAPIWERESLNALLAADLRQEWRDLFVLGNQFGLPDPDGAIQQAFRALALFDRPRLLKIADAATSWFDATLITSGLPLAQALILAETSKSDYVRFALIDRITVREVRPLDEEDTRALRNFLIRLGADFDMWPVALSILNSYPSRYSHIREALGRALAHLAPWALEAYVDSIELRASDKEGSLAVAGTLEVFRRHAPPWRQNVIWKRAYDRWTEWNFGANSGEGLDHVSSSALDYAVVGWVMGLGTGASDLETEFEVGLRELDTLWLPSRTVAISHFNRLLSRYNLKMHAIAARASALSWLPGKLSKMPKAATPFVCRRYAGLK